MTLISNVNNEIYLNLVGPYAKWMEECVLRGGKLYYVNFMFEELGGPKSELVHKMKWSIERFYATFVTQFVHHPRAHKERYQMPEFWLFPDLPVRKRKKQELDDISLNDGLHFNGAMIINAPPRKSSRLCTADYTKNGIIRIDVRKADQQYFQLADYAFKTVVSGRVDSNDILILPRCVSELPNRSVQTDSKYKRAMKTLVSAHSLSVETAKSILDRQQNGGTNPNFPLGSFSSF